MPVVLVEEFTYGRSFDAMIGSPDLNASGLLLGE